MGRDQGAHQRADRAMFAAARSGDFHIAFGGTMQFHYASDVAQQFVPPPRNRVREHWPSTWEARVTVNDVALAIMAERQSVTITCADTILPFPIGCDDNAARPTHVYETPLAAGVAATIAAFTQLNS
ncbi:MAG: hypothetical protein U0X20_07370 [Caldilineaceae bacterium]